jgi:hypothetical protein
MDLNRKGVTHADKLIADGKVDKTSSWSIDAADENAILGNGDWGAYSAMHLGCDPAADPKTKAAWKYPFGKGGKVYRSALIAIRDRAGQQHAEKIEDAAGRLLERIDGKSAKENFAEGAKKVEIFRSGRQRSSDGREIEFSPGDLRASAEAYDPGLHEAPIVVGHPKTDDPAYGWVTGLDCPGSSLFAEIDQVDPAFADLVRAGRFRKVSACFYTPDSPRNPVPGVYYLRHVGFLGAEPPALKGLKPVAFADGEDGIIECSFSVPSRTEGRRDEFNFKPRRANHMPERVDFHEGVGKGAASLLRRIREHILRKHGQDEADETVPSEHIAALEEEAHREGEEARRAREGQTATGEHGGAAYAEGEKAKEIEKREAELKAREVEFSEKQKVFAEQEKKSRHEGFVAFCDALAKEGRLLPVSKASAVAILDFAASADGDATIEFAEGDRTVKVSPVQAIKALLSSQPKAVTYGERVNTEDAIPEGEDGQREAKITEYMEKHKGVSYRDAMIEVSRECPQLFGVERSPKK